MVRLKRNRMERKKRIVLKLVSVIFIVLVCNCKDAQSVNQESRITDVPCQSVSGSTTTEAIEDGMFIAHKSKSQVQIDGCDNDAIWSQVTWFDMNYLWMGNRVEATDYRGRFKLAWDSEYLYILVEVIDDVLHPTLENGIENYWKGDYVEVFIDEDASGGNHQFNHQAFAYHVSTEGHAIDLNTAQRAVFFDNHITVARSQVGTTYLWEMAIKLFDKVFDENQTNNKPINIVAQKRIGFSIAYGDNDGNNIRENFMGSKKTHGINNDEGYINSDVFGNILCLE